MKLCPRKYWKQNGNDEFSLPISSTFSYATCKRHANILSCDHQHKGCEKRYQRQSQCQSPGFVGREMWIKEYKAWTVASVEIVGGCPHLVEAIH